MSAETVTWVWVGAGLTLIAAEFLLPGLITVFLGEAALVVAGGRWLGWIDGMTASLMTFFVASVVLLVGVRGFFTRLVPGNTEKELADEDVDAFGQIVEVTEALSAKQTGRISFRGASWNARGTEHALKAGDKARIVYRDNLDYIVEPADPIKAALPEENDE